MANQGVLPNSSLPDNNFRVWLFHTVAAVGMVILLWAGFGSIREALTRAQHELQQRQLSEARLAKIFKASPNAQTISELATGIILDVNESFEVLLGYSKEMVLGRSAAELNIYGEKEGRQIWLDMLNEQGFVHELEMPLRHKEGDIRTCLLSIEVIELDGRPCTISFVQDITDRKQAELAVLQTRDDLREREAQLRTILDNLPFWVWLKDVNGHFLMINELFIKENPIYSYKEEIVGKTDLDIAPPELANKYRGDDTWVMENLSSLSVEEPVLTHGEMKTFETYKAPYWGNDNQLLGTFGFARDITERKQAAADREMLIQELERRNAELERFAYTVSHDLKSPLVTIGGFLGFVEKDAAEGDTEQLKKDIDSIWQAANKMRLLLDELLELSRIGRLMNPPEEVPFAEIVTEALVLTQGQTIGCEIDIVSAHEFPSVIGDRLRLVEVVQNLVDNAAKFSRDQPQPRIKIGVRQGNGDPVFFVQDNGIGIPPQYHNDIFDIFNKLNPDLEGTGIGLALVKRIVEVHNGRLWVESEGLGHGSTFCFSLPKVVVKTDAK
ncbi:MAG: PAS domain S-box protein, partial [Anaerolineae bacterium]|nr:PAS domain S-box protein [Anaerolineae bacterium]